MKRIVSLILACALLISMLPSTFVTAQERSNEGYDFRFIHAAHTSTESIATNTTCKFEDSARDPQIMHTLDTVASGYDAWGYVAQSFPYGTASVSTEGKSARFSYYRPGKNAANAVTFDKSGSGAATAVCFEVVVDEAGSYSSAFEYLTYSVGPTVDIYFLPKPEEAVTNSTLSDFVKALDEKYKLMTVDSCGKDIESHVVENSTVLELEKNNYYLIMVANGESETAAANALAKNATYHYFLPVAFKLNAVKTYPDTPTLTYDFNMLDGANVNNVMLDTTNARYANTKGTWEYTGVGVTWMKTQTSYGVNIGTTASVPYAVLKINVPFAGKYDAKLIHHMNKSSGGKGDVYILPGDADISSIDKILSNTSKKTVATNVNYFNSEGTNIFDNETAATKLVFENGGEYYLVFHATGTDSGSYGTYPHKLVLAGTSGNVKLMYFDADVSATQLEAGASADISVLGYMTDGSGLPANAEITYKSSDSSVASVDNNGKVSAISMGSAEITVTATVGEVSLYDKINVIVTGKLPTTVTLTYDFNQLNGATADAVMLSASNANYLTTSGTWAYSGFGITNIKTQAAYGVYISATAKNAFGAFKINIPYAGKYDAKLIHHMNKTTGGIGDVYILPGDADISSVDKILSNTSKKTVATDVNYFNSEGTNIFDNETSATNLVFEKAGEYYLVFNTTGTASGTYGMYPHKLILEGENKDGNAVMFLDVTTSKKLIAKGESMEFVMNGWMTDGSKLSDAVEYTYTPAEEGIVSIEGNKITGIEDGRTSISVKASVGELELYDDVNVIVDSAEKAGYKLVYNIGDVSKANVNTKPAFATMTRESNKGFWAYLANSQDQATPNWAFAYTNTGICIAQNRWVSFEIFVSVEGIYSMYVEHGMHSGGCDTSVYVSDADSEESPIADEYFAGSFNTLKSDADGYKTPNSEPSYIANVNFKKGWNRVAFRAPRSSGDAYAVAGNIILDGGEELWIMSADMEISESGKITLSGILSDGSAADMELAEVKYHSSNTEVAEAPESGHALKLKTYGTTVITADIKLGEANLSISKEFEVTKLPAPFSGIDAQFRFFEKNGAWDPINNPVEGFPQTDRIEDIRGITYEYTGISGNGNWQYNVAGPNWIPAKYAVFLYAGVEENASHYMRLQMPGNGDWLAFDIKVPAAGRYIAEYLYSVYYRSASVSDIYILPKNETTDTKEEIGALLVEDNRIATVDYLDQTATSGYSARKIEIGDLVFDAAGEYILVFRRNDGGRGGYINPKMFTLYGVNGMHYANISVDKTDLEFGEIANVSVTATRLDGSVVTEDAYEMSITSSNPEAVEITENGEIKGVGDGEAIITVTVVDNTGKKASSDIAITAKDNTGIAEDSISVDPTLYVGQKTKISWLVTMNSKNVLSVAPDTITYTYDPEGIVTVDSDGNMLGVAAGKTTVTASSTFKGQQIEKSVEIEVEVDDRKSEPTYYTYEMREILKENIKKYDWAAASAESELKTADKYVEQMEVIYESMPGQGIPITIRPGRLDDPEYKLCRYCGVDVIAKYGNGTTGGWKFNIVTSPWKIQCPECKRKFPSNDFAKLYELGRDQAGYYDPERARAENEKLKEESNGKTDYLKNDLYPELWSDPTKDTYNKDPLRKDENGNYYEVDGMTWGVDDGFGYRTGRVFSNGVKEEHMYIGTYLWNYFGEVYQAILRTSRAYVFSDDPKYGRAGAILLDRMADLFPGYDFAVYDKAYPSSDGGSGLGKLHGRIDDSDYAQKFALACDAFFPIINDAEVVKYLSAKAEKWGLENDKSTGEKIWDNWEYGILDETYRAMQRRDIQGNFGMHQLALATAAIVRDREPVTSEMIEWIYATNTTNAAREATGGDLMTKLIDVIDRDGMGDEAAPNYNSVWITRMYQIAEMLALYKGEEDYDLYENPKFTQMFTSFMPTLLAESHTVEIGDTGGVASLVISDGISLYPIAFRFLKDTEYGPKIANYLYMRNGYTTEGLNYGMYVEDPERLERELEEYIDPNFTQQSEMMTGFGFAVLRGGMKTRNTTTQTRKNTLRDIWMYFGKTSGHGHAQLLNLGMEAYGLNIAPDTGYPELTGYQPNRWQWVRTTISHNTVTVNEREQKAVNYATQPLHFEDAGKVKVMDIDASNAYDTVDKYRRTAVMIEANDDVSYTVDFFRVKGGDTHTYSFHSQAENAYPIEGIELSYQTEDGTANTPYVGSYADVNWPVGEDPNSPYVGSYETVYPRGYSWMGKVRRDTELESNKISVEFDAKDYRRAINDSTGIKLRMTQVNDFVPSEVAIVGGYMPQSSRNTGMPSTLDYVLVHRKGKDLDTMFTTVLEPYKNTRYISEIDAVEVTVADGEEKDSDAVRAVKVTHTSGRIDYVVHATNNTVTYNVGDVFNFRGVVGVYSVNANDEIIYRYVTDGDIIGEATENDACVTGTIAGYQKELTFDNYIDIRTEYDDAASLVGKYINVANDGARNAVYKIEKASENEDGTIRLGIGTISLIRGHKNTQDFHSGYIYDIQNNQSFVIPLSFKDENLPEFVAINNKLSTSTGSLMKFNVKAESPLGREIKYVSQTLPRGVELDEKTGAISWKPTSSQVGDNHFEITAVDSDGRENTLHFIVSVYGSTTGTVGTGNSAGTGTTKPQTPSKPETPTEPEKSETPEVEEKTFTDLGNHAWAEDAINALAKDGIIKGTSSTTYSPAANITRADFAILLVRAFELESDSTENFADVADSDYFAKELAIARNNGIINGVGDNKYAPRNTITRQDMMTIVYRAMVKLGVELEKTTDAEMPDTDAVANYAKEAVNALIGAGLVNGKSGKIAPTDYTTRAEVAVLLKRILDYMA